MPKCQTLLNFATLTADCKVHYFCYDSRGLWSEPMKTPSKGIYDKCIEFCACVRTKKNIWASYKYDEKE